MDIEASEGGGYTAPSPAVGSLLFSIGSALAGAAPLMSLLIVGRVFAGVGGASMLQSSVTPTLSPFQFARFPPWKHVELTCYMQKVRACSYSFTTLAERSIYQAGVGLFWVVGMLLGPIVSAAFASNPSTTWRWAFYIVIPFMED